MMRTLLVAVIVAVILATLAGCSNAAAKNDINRLLDARDAAISHKDIGAYSSLLLSDYMDDHGKTKISVVAQFVHMFEEFDKTDMHSFDREIRLLDRNHAQCEQSYKLRVKADGRWREVVQREQIYFVRTPAGWRISGGL